MTICIFSDIHANLPALEAVFEDIDHQRPDMIFCLGDLVGYAPWPNEVTEMIRSRGIPTIAGNYDEGVGLNSDDCGCAYKTDEERARGSASIAYTNSVVTDETRAYLRGLPRHIRIEFGTGEEQLTVLMVHGSPRRINEYLFEDRPDASFLRIMHEANADIMLFGHTHKPFHKILTYERDGRSRQLHAINTGSVGKPKDGDPRAGYVIVRTEGGGGKDGGERTEDGEERMGMSIRVEFVRVEYDVERAARAVEESPLPDAFAAMLRSGG